MPHPAGFQWRNSESKKLSGKIFDTEVERPFRIQIQLYLTADPEKCTLNMKYLRLKVQM